MKVILILSSLMLLSTSACANSSTPKSDQKKVKEHKAVPVKNAPEKATPAGEKGNDHFLKSPLVKKIHKRQARRMGVIQSLKKKGVIGESEDGTLKIRNSNSLSKKDKATMEKLVKAENDDRLLVYQEMAKLQKWNKVDYNVLRRKMFETYVDVDPTGTYYYRNRAWLRK